jgi:GTP-binding protein
MIIKSAEFIISSTEVEKCPKNNFPEYAFIGRSNVGKSSLINMLTGFNSLAKVSGRPGKTRLINHFLINKEWYLVDLPGYGFAQVAKSERGKVGKIHQKIPCSARKLVCVFVLVDSRHEPQKTIFRLWNGWAKILFFCNCIYQTDNWANRR